MQRIEKEDIQGLIVRGYGKLKAARFVLLNITNPQNAKKYISHLSDNVNTGIQPPDDFAVNVAFTSDGLRLLGLPEDALATYSREFLEGMSDDFRALILGDQNKSNPLNWKWGGPNNSKVHMLLLFYAKDDKVLEKEYNSLINSAEFVSGTSIIAVKETYACMDSKEHFGFRDGISNPRMEGLEKDEVASGNKKGSTNNENSKKSSNLPLKAGEFVLGYKNEYDRYTQIPSVLASHDSNDILPVNSEDRNKKNLGQNGTYLVYREIEQDVLGFWKYLEANSNEIQESKVESAKKLGAKMVGRWLSGCPLVLSDKEDDKSKAMSTDFNYFEEDPEGLKCPIGSHIRRTNPRDQLMDHDKSDSIEMIRKHQLLRRGRTFGKPLVESMKPEDVLQLQNDDGQKRGLQFICLNADLSRQFEFVQNIWVQSSKFGGLFNDGDPIIGSRIKNSNDEFTCPAEPLRTKYKQLPQFTTVVGGAYFFLPGVKALKFIANI